MATVPPWGIPSSQLLTYYLTGMYIVMKLLCLAISTQCERSISDNQIVIFIQDLRSHL